MGPFIIFDMAPGTRLSSFLRLPVDDRYDAAILNLDMDETTLDIVHEQTASYILQMSRLTFLRTRVIFKDDGNLSNGLLLGGRLVTFDMDILATSTRHPVDKF